MIKVIKELEEILKELHGAWPLRAAVKASVRLITEPSDDLGLKT